MKMTLSWLFLFTGWLPGAALLLFIALAAQAQQPVGMAPAKRSLPPACQKL